MYIHSMWFLYNINPYNVYIYNVYLSIYGEISGNIVFLYFKVRSIQGKTDCNILYKVYLYFVFIYYVNVSIKKVLYWYVIFYSILLYLYVYKV